MTRTTARPDTTQVVVIGAGYAGLMATNRFLGSLTELERRRTTVTVVNPRAAFVERIRLHELAAGSRSSVTIPLSWLLHDDARMVVGRARLIDTSSRTVVVETGAETARLPYDHLVYAVGSVPAAPIPGAAQHAFLVGDHDGAAAAAAAVRCAGTTFRAAVVGGGLTGVETAGELAEQHPDAEVTLYSAGPIVSDMRPAARRSLLKSLGRLGVRVEMNTAVVKIEDGELRLGDGRVRQHDICIVAAAFDVPDLASASALRVDEAGRLMVDHHLRCLDDPTILGAGDAIVAPPAVAGHLRMGCATALPLGAHAAQTLLATIRGTTPGPLSIGFAVQCISLGRKKGYIQLVRADDTPRRLHVGGRLGARIKEKICEMVVSSPKAEAMRPGAYSWPKGPKRTLATRTYSMSARQHRAGERYASAVPAPAALLTRSVES